MEVGRQLFVVVPIIFSPLVCGTQIGIPVVLKVCIDLTDPTSLVIIAGLWDNPKAGADTPCLVGIKDRFEVTFLWYLMRFYANAIFCFTTASSLRHGGIKCSAR